MSTFNSPMDPAFYTWHGEIDGIVKEWLQTENGEVWANENPEAAANWKVTPEEEWVIESNPITTPKSFINKDLYLGFFW